MKIQQINSFVKSLIFLFAAYRDAFALFDKDHDGKITAAELAVVMKQLGFDPKEAEVCKMIHEVDKNLNNTVEFDEFVVMMKKHQKIRDAEQELRDAFRVRQFSLLRFPENFTSTFKS